VYIADYPHIYALFLSGFRISSVALSFGLRYIYILLYCTWVPCMLFFYSGAKFVVCFLEITLSLWMLGSLSLPDERLCPVIG
jgi:hypothetical protein